MQTGLSSPQKDSTTINYETNPPDPIYEEPVPTVDDVKDELSGPWDECLGMDGKECADLILNDSPDLIGHIYIIPPNTPVTEDYRLDRVRIMVDKNNMVMDVPGRG